MRGRSRGGLALALVALACAAADCDPEPQPSPVWGDAPTDRCATEPVVGLVACPTEVDFPFGEELRGAFSGWQPGEVDFVTTDGDDYRIDLAGGPEAFYGLPDLAGERTLRLAIEGWCDLIEGPQTVMLAWKDGQEPDAIEALLMLAGNTISASAAGWFVESPRDDDACPDAARSCDCWETCRSKPVHFDGPTGTASLHQREETLRGDLVLRVAESWSGAGTGACDDSNRETQVWMVFPR